jgi:hypothetical protein
MHRKRGIAAAHLQAAANRQRAQGAIDQQVRAAVETYVFKVDSRGR